MNCNRLAFAAAREGQMPEILSYIHIHRFTPAPAVTLQVVVAKTTANLNARLTMSQ